VGRDFDEKRFARHRQRTIDAARGCTLTEDLSKPARAARILPDLIDRSWK
jgi:hypothetical protein